MLLKLQKIKTNFLQHWELDSNSVVAAQYGTFVAVYYREREASVHPCPHGYGFFRAGSNLVLLLDTLLLFSDLKIAVRTNSVFRSRLSTPPILFARSTRRPPQLIHLLMTLKKLAREEVGVLSGSTALTACNFSGALQFSVSRVHRSC